MRELRNKTTICMQGFDDDSIKTNTPKFQFMICHRKNGCPKDAQIGHGLTGVKIVKLLDTANHLLFDIHVTGLCKKNQGSA